MKRPMSDSLNENLIVSQIKDQAVDCIEHIDFTEQTINLMLTHPARLLSPLSPSFFTFLYSSQPVLLKHRVKQTINPLFE